MVLHTLNLTAGQRAQIHKIMRSQQATLKTLFEQRREGRQKLEAELFSPGPVTMANLTPFEQNNAQIDQQIHRTFLQIALQIRGVLTQAQISRGATTLARMQQLQNEMHSLYALDDNFPPAPEGK
jgi:Spy/CpxP family protein refolding chaperone